VLELTLLVFGPSFAIKHRLTSSSSFDDELEDDSSLSCQDMQALLALPLFSNFLLAPFSLLSLFKQSTLMRPCFPHPKQV